MTEVLLNWLELRIHIEAVLGEFSRYTRHVRRFPCKDVPILTGKLDERAFLFGVHIRPNSEHLGRVARHEFHLFGVFG
jgi:hypothetical protein